MRDAVASQLIHDDLPGFTAIISKQPFEEPPRSCTVASCMQKHIECFYNRKRRHGYLGNITPVAFEKRTSGRYETVQ